MYAAEQPNERRQNEGQKDRQRDRYQQIPSDVERGNHNGRCGERHQSITQQSVGKMTRENSKTESYQGNILPAVAIFTDY